MRAKCIGHGRVAPDVGYCETKTIDVFQRHIHCSATQMCDCLAMKVKGKAREVFDDLSRELQQLYVQIVSSMETKILGPFTSDLGKK